jgi:hypothetical protein
VTILQNSDCLIPRHLKYLRGFVRGRGGSAPKRFHTLHHRFGSPSTLGAQLGAEMPLTVVAYSISINLLIRRVAAETACRVGMLGQAGCTGGAFVKNNTEVEEAGCGPGGDPRNILPRAWHGQDSGVDARAILWGAWSLGWLEELLLGGVGVGGITVRKRMAAPLLILTPTCTLLLIPHLP